MHRKTITKKIYIMHGGLFFILLFIVLSTSFGVAKSKDDGSWFQVPSSYYTEKPVQYRGQTLFHQEIAEGIFLRIQGRAWRQGELLYLRLSTKQKDVLTDPTIIYWNNKKTFKIQLFQNKQEKYPEKRKLFEALLPITPYQKIGLMKFTLVGLPAPLKKYQFNAHIVKGKFLNYYYKANLSVAKKFTKKKNSELAKKIKEENRRINQAYLTSQPGQRYWTVPFVHPTKGTVITGPFFTRRYYNNKPGFPHSGTDFRGKVGHPVAAITNGRVVYAEKSFYSGKMVILDHGNHFYTNYKHLSQIQVKVGDWVEKGKQIGQVGRTGLVTGPHLHLTLYLHGIYVDPLSMVPH